MQKLKISQRMQEDKSQSDSQKKKMIAFLAYSHVFFMPILNLPKMLKAER